MKLKLLISNSLTSLAHSLSDTLRTQDKNVFQPDHIITQTDGMSNWLTLQIAEAQGIAANLQFLKPNDLIQYLFRLVSARQGPAISRQSLDWLIYQVLSSEAFQKEYPDKAAYFLDDPLTADVKKLSLARKLSDLFDQYQVYRSEEIISWNKDQLLSIPAEFRWQAFIWKKINEIAGDQLPDMTDIRTEILQALQDPEKIKKIATRIPVIYLFGLSVITSYHIRILYELSAHIPLYIYLLNPAPEFYWVSDHSEKDLLRMRSSKDKTDTYLNRGNNLLTNWGKLLQSTFGMLYQNEEIINVMQETGLKIPERDTLLHKIQYDIYYNVYEDIQFTEADLSDGSLVLTGNYSKVREVQVLYNYLTGLFVQEMPGLKARDVLVMVNNIEDYSPYIRAVFDNAPYRLPYTIADEPVTTGNTPISCLISLLEINEQELTAENVLQLLEYKNIRDRFGIYDTELIRRAVNEASIRFGIDNSTANDSYLVSWRYGLQRMMYGLCMSGAPILEKDGRQFIPLDEFEGTVALQQLSLFSRFVEELFTHLRDRKKPRTLSRWVQYLSMLMDNFIDIGGDENEKYIKIIDEQLKKYADVAPLVDEPVSFEIFSRHLRDNLSHEQQTKLFSSGGITFCSLIPMRSIPFQVIALLGMGFTEFPRKENQADFDLIHHQHRLGDRSIRDNDKQLFLETLLSAGERLYISYTSRSIRDNSVIPPSILVDELLDYIQSGYNAHRRSTGESREEVTAYLFTQHPLHNISSTYNRDAKAPVNYLLKSESPINFTVEQPEENLPQTDLLRLDDLIAFMKKPIDHYYKNVLGIRLYEDEILIPDTEVFTLDRLGESALQKDVITHLMYGGDISEAISRHYLAGKLPLHNMGEHIRQQQMELSEVLRGLISTADGNKIAKQEFELEINGLTLTGSLPYCCAETLYQVITNSKIESGLLQAWITYIAGVAAGLVRQNVLLHYHKNINETYLSREMSAEAAHTILAGLVTFYLDNKDQLLVFAPAFIAKDFQKCETDDSALRVIATKVDNENNKSYDPYLNDAYFKGLLDKTGALNDVRYFLHKMEEAKGHLGIPN